MATEPLRFGEKRFPLPHHYQSLLYFFMLGSGLAFLTFTLLFFYRSQAPAIGLTYLPKWFAFSLFLLLVGSISAQKMQTAFDRENPRLLNQLQLWLIFIIMAFTCSQAMGWQELRLHLGRADQLTSRVLVYLSSGLHLLHLLAGLVWSFIRTQKIRRLQNDPVRQLVFFQNPAERLYLKLYAHYWHFLDVLWVLLFFAMFFAL
jgi:cytochrome c oxidase subunit 3